MLELNDREENESHFPIIYGIAVNIKTAEIYRASFQDRGPEEELRAARALTGGPVSPTASCLNRVKGKGGASNSKALSFIHLGNEKFLMASGKLPMIRNHHTLTARREERMF